MWYNKFMNKNYKRCPRCNYKTPVSMPKCGNCGLNYDKFNSATNEEAKSAFRMGENERVLYTTQRPNDVNKIAVLLKCMFAGWFGLHYFSIGRKWRGLFQLVGVVFGIIYATAVLRIGYISGYFGAFLLLLGIIWLASFIIWLTDIVSIVFNRFKYPVSLPYSSKAEK